MTPARDDSAHARQKDRHHAPTNDERWHSAEPADPGPVEESAPCVCLKCGYREPARPHVACRVEICPECGATTVREGSPRHQAYVKGRLHRNA
jgi:hypothetical protein